MTGEDSGKRYEVRVNPSPWGTPVCGWHETKQGAQRLASASVKHPEIQEAWVLDRGAENAEVYRVSK